MLARLNVMACSWLEIGMKVKVLGKVSKLFALQMSPVNKVLQREGAGGGARRGVPAQ